LSAERRPPIIDFSDHDITCASVALSILAGRRPAAEAIRVSTRSREGGVVYAAPGSSARLGRRGRAV